MKINKTKRNRVPTPRTHGGSVAHKINFEKQLERSVLSCFLWEDLHYEGGESVADRIKNLVGKVDPHFVYDLAVRARTEMHLRHVPLFLLRELVRYTTNSIVKRIHSGDTEAAKYKFDSDEIGPIVREALPQVILRADELAEFLSLYWKDNKQPIAASVKKGLAKAFDNFNEYQFGKYKGKKGNVSLRDVMFLVHAKPENYNKESLYAQIADNTLEIPDTWEVALSSGKDKKETWIRLIEEGKLGGLAILRNLRNMENSGVPLKIILWAIQNGNYDRVLPFRFVEARKCVTNPKITEVLDEALQNTLEPELFGSTLIVVDKSGSMCSSVSNKSNTTRLDAAISLAIMGKGLSEKCTVYATAGDDFRRIHATGLVIGFGFKLENSIRNANIGGGGIFLVQCLEHIAKETKQAYDRVIVITDEQDCDKKLKPEDAPKLGINNYVVNISVERNGISYKNGWEHIDGFSENVFRYIAACELDFGLNHEEKWN